LGIVVIIALITRLALFVVAVLTRVAFLTVVLIVIVRILACSGLGGGLWIIVVVIIRLIVIVVRLLGGLAVAIVVLTGLRRARHDGLRIGQWMLQCQLMVSNNCIKPRDRRRVELSVALLHKQCCCVVSCCVVSSVAEVVQGGSKQTHLRTA